MPRSFLFSAACLKSEFGRPLTSELLLQQSCFVIKPVESEFSVEEEEVSVTARPQRECLTAQLLPGLLVRLGGLLVVPVGLQLCFPGHMQEKKILDVKQEAKILDSYYSKLLLNHHRSIKKNIG